MLDGGHTSDSSLLYFLKITISAWEKLMTFGRIACRSNRFVQRRVVSNEYRLGKGLVRASDDSYHVQTHKEHQKHSSNPRLHPRRASLCSTRSEPAHLAPGYLECIGELIRTVHFRTRPCERKSSSAKLLRMKGEMVTAESLVARRS